jgi:hypothetical protein
MTATRTEACVSDLTLDRLLAGELETGPLGEGARAHLEGCAACRARHQAFVAARDAFPKEVFVSGLAAQARSRARRPSRRIAAAGGALALAASLVLVVQVTRGPTERLKGGEGLAVVVKRASGKVEPLLSGGRVAPGEAIRFRISSPKDAFVFVVGMDSAGQVSPYAAGDGMGVQRRAGTDGYLAGSIVLDDTPGVEQLAAVFCPGPTPVKAVTDAARAALEKSGGHPEAVAALPVACVQRFFLLRKAVP